MFYDRVFKNHDASPRSSSVTTGLYQRRAHPMAQMAIGWLISGWKFRTLGTSSSWNTPTIYSNSCETCPYRYPRYLSPDGRDGRDEISQSSFFLFPLHQELKEQWWFLSKVDELAGDWRETCEAREIKERKHQTSALLLASSLYRSKRTSCGANRSV